MRTVYKTKSGLEIGKYYEPKVRYEQSRDMDRLQSALIDPVPERRFGILNAILWALSVAMFAAMVYAPVIWGILDKVFHE